MYDVLIIGGGPCGVSASIYLKRAGYNVAVIEKSFIGGQIGLSSELVNYAGFVEKDAFIFCQNMSRQLKDLDVPVIYDTVVDIKKKADKNFVIRTKLQDEYSSRAVVLSIGAENRKLGLQDELKFVGRGVSYCSICDGNRFKDKTVLVVGGGNSAFEDVIYLSKICKKVYLINRTDKFRAELYLQKELNSKKEENDGNIVVKTFARLKSVTGKDYVEKAVVEHNGIDEEINLDGVFISIGRVPSSNFLDGFVKMENKYIVVDSDYQTNVAGVFAGGDCIPKQIRQVVTAVSDGAIIAKKISAFLQ